MENQPLEYAGFWPRVGATIIDQILLTVVLLPLLIYIYGWRYFASESLVSGPADFIISWVAPALIVFAFWTYKQATPGKMAISARIVDAKTGLPASDAQLITRYIGYFISAIPLCLGLIWVAFDRRKQGWHDKLAGTVVVRNTAPEPVHFHRASQHSDRTPYI